MRILILNWKDLAHSRAGGAEVYLEEIARRWAAGGHEVTLFCAAVDGRSADEVVEGVRILRRGGRFGVYREARRYYENEGRGSHDVVLDGVNTRPFHTPRFVTDIPVVALIHQLCREIWWYEMPLPIAVAGRFWLERRWLRDYADVPVATVSQSSRASLADYGLRDLTVVPEGFTPQTTAPVQKEDRPTVIFVGRLSANKRPLHALEAFRLIREQVPDAQLWIVGDGPQCSKVERKAGEGVTLWGRVDDATRNELMSRSHVLVVTSVREGWGLVVDEALSLGTGTVGYDRPGLRDSIPAAGGALVDAVPRSLADGVLRAIRDGQLLPAQGGAVSWDDAAAALLEQLQSACDRFNGARAS